jgi:hypothetical protein
MLLNAVSNNKRISRFFVGDISDLPEGRESIASAMQQVERTERVLKTVWRERNQPKTNWTEQYHLLETQSEQVRRTALIILQNLLGPQVQDSIATQLGKSLAPLGLQGLRASPPAPDWANPSPEDGRAFRPQVALDLEARERQFNTTETKNPNPRRTAMTNTTNGGSPPSEALIPDKPAGSMNFVCNALHARSVSLVGDFNQWNPAVHRMERAADETWYLNIDLKYGHYRYAFLVDGNLTLDPRAQGITRNDRGERVSLVSVS